MKIPKDFPVRPLKPGTTAKDRATCGTCGLSWDDAIPTTWTPVPSGRCPFEYFHVLTNEETEQGFCHCGAFEIVHNRNEKTGVCFIRLDEREEMRRGELLAKTLNVRKDKDGRYKTEWGTKTPLGLFRTVQRLITEGK